MLSFYQTNIYIYPGRPPLRRFSPGIDDVQLQIQVANLLNTILIAVTPILCAHFSWFFHFSFRISDYSPELIQADRHPAVYSREPFARDQCASWSEMAANGGWFLDFVARARFMNEFFNLATFLHNTFFPLIYNVVNCYSVCAVAYLSSCFVRRGCVHVCLCVCVLRCAALALLAFRKLPNGSEFNVIYNRNQIIASMANVSFCKHSLLNCGISKLKHTTLCVNAWKQWAVYQYTSGRCTIRRR